MKNVTILLISIIFSITAKAQCTIPNNNFEDFYERTGGGLGPVEVIYLLPNDWTESVVPNVFSRAIRGEGFFYRYEDEDANGYALELQRGTPEASSIPVNSGFIRFECSDVPNKIKGKYKFSGSDLSGVTDTLKIASYFRSVTDTLTTANEHYAGIHNLSDAPDAVILNITEATSEFMDFELDMTPFLGEDVDYVTIQLIMKTGSSNQFNPGYSTAVIDELKFVYEPTNTIEGFNESNPFTVYPNPVHNNIYIDNEEGAIIKSVTVFDIAGRAIINKNNITSTSTTINTNNLTKGTYILTVTTLDNSVYTKKIIKQ